MRNLNLIHLSLISWSSRLKVYMSNGQCDYKERSYQYEFYQHILIVREDFEEGSQYGLEFPAHHLLCRLKDLLVLHASLHSWLTHFDTSRHFWILCVYMFVTQKVLVGYFFFWRELKSLVTLHTHTTAKLSLYLKEGLLFLTILYMYRIQLKNVTHSHMTSLVDQHKTNPEFNEG